jgi:ribose 5-phosphate isomerase B
MISKEKKIVIGSDHYGLTLKILIKSYLNELGYQTDDLGVQSEEPVDYPSIGIKVAKAVGRGEYENGILVCGTGAGMAIVANKIPGVRAVCVSDPYTAERARASNNANIITMGSQVTGSEVAKKLIDIWLASEFQAGRSISKVAKIDQLDTEFRKN